ncbi:MAG: ABC transporter ATP-binding protein [Hydrogenophaga sp.]|uniref:ABC transporter ATP-binding protein n=1 Tax=Hydrogenophaga sp. TaxID=1904254 RepID=UPI003D9B52AF
MNDHHPLLQAVGLSFGWPGQPLLNDLTLDIPPGLTVVRGDEGCGKTTLLRLLASEWTPQAGSLRRPGLDISPSDAAWAQQVCWFDPRSTAHDEVVVRELLARQAAQHPGHAPDLLNELIDAFSLEQHLHKPMYMLSTGSQRKVWLSLSFAAQAPVTLLDQPFAALDGPSVRCVRELLEDAAEHTSRAWVVADHEAPPGLHLAGDIAL